MYPGVKLLEGKRALVTGVANRWSIASGIARQMHAHGARLILTYQGERVEDSVRKAAAELGGAGARMRRYERASESLRKVAAGAGKIDGLVHSIAFVEKEGPRWEGLRHCTRRLCDGDGHQFLLADRSGGHSKRTLNDGASVMALTYLGGTQIVPNYNVAGIAKAALESIVRYLAFDLGERGIRVNAISAGPISTASSRQVAGFSAMPAKVAAAAPLRRTISADDVGNCAVYLASDLSSQVTADVHFVDAGYHAMGMYPELP